MITEKIQYLGTFKEVAAAAKEARATRTESKRHYFITKLKSGEVVCVFKSKKVQEENQSLDKNKFADNTVAILPSGTYTLCGARTEFTEEDAFQ